MSSRPLVSVVTVCRNAVAGIEATVKSVTSQAYRDLEYVVVDGASTDGTLEVLRRHAGAITTLVSEPDAGIFHAMNKALGLVHGDIVVFMNAGDVFASGATVEQVVSAFGAHPGAVMVYGDCWEVDESGRIHMPQPAVATRWALWLKAICHQTMFARRELFERMGGFDESLRVSADWDWTLRALRDGRNKAVHVPMDVCLYARGGVSSDRAALEDGKAIMRRRHYSVPERMVYGIGEFFLKIWRRLRMRNFSPPWRLRRVLSPPSDKDAG